MAIKLTIQGLLIYAAMAAYLSGVAAWLAGARKLAWGAYAAGFVLAGASCVYRGLDAGHAPLANMFEVLLFMGMLMFPLSVFCRRLLGVGGECWDMLIAAAVLAGPGFAMKADAAPLMPALQSPLFIPHVAAYLIGYVVMGKAAVAAVGLLVKGHEAATDREPGVHRLMCLAFPLLTAGLVLGAVWGKLAWGDWWNWDPKELWSLAGWLICAGYFHYRAMSGRARPRANATIVLAAAAVIVITLLWVNLAGIFAGLHSYA